MNSNEIVRKGHKSLIQSKHFFLVDRSEINLSNALTARLLLNLFPQCLFRDSEVQWLSIREGLEWERKVTGVY